MIFFDKGFYFFKEISFKKQFQIIYMARVVRMRKSKVPKKSARVFIGTSGWNYNHWRTIFYPEDLSAREWFNYYSKSFDTVEINNTFYNLPDASVFKNWKRQAPNDFIYAVKTNRYITHMKKLKKCETALTRFFSRTRYLGENLGPILYQLPPYWKCDVRRLEEFLKKLPKDKTHVFEFRDDSWLTKEVFKILELYNVSFCVHDIPYVKCPEIAIGNVGYLRLHGVQAIYQGGYPIRTLKKWADWIITQSKTRDVYVYFNNDAEGHAVEDAVKLKKFFAKKS
jgi:uncharacterized protein YecE (DUF72 family)